MNFDLTVLDTSARGVQVTLRSTSVAFWLPRHHPAVVWSAPPKPGEHVSVRLPTWLVQKHGPLREVRHQVSMSFHQPPGLGPAASTEGSFPMAYDNDMSGALFKNNKKEKPSHPDYQGKAEIHGKKFWISAWIKTSEKDGRRYMSLSFRPVEERTDERQQQQPAGPTFGDDQIPFAPEVR